MFDKSVMESIFGDNAGNTWVYSNPIPKVQITFSLVTFSMHLSKYNKQFDKNYEYDLDRIKFIYNKIVELKDKTYDLISIIRYLQTLFYYKDNEVLIFIDNNHCSYIMINSVNTGICITKDHVISCDVDKVI